MDSKARKRVREMEGQMEALIIAIPKEEASYHFYLDLEKNAEHEGAKTMFHMLAEEELEHKRKLEKYVEKLRVEIARVRKQSS